MADDEQQKSSEQNVPIANTSGPNNEAGLVATDGNVESNEENGSTGVVCPAEVSQSAKGNAPGQVTNMEDRQTTLVVEQESDETGKAEEEAKPDPSSDDQTNANKDVSNQDLMSSSQQNQDSNPDTLGQDLNSGSISQNLDPCSPDQDSNSGPPDPDQVMEVIALDQDSNNGLPLSDPIEVEKTREAVEGDNAKEEHDATGADVAVPQPEPYQVVHGALLVTEDTGGNAAEMVPTSDELQQSQTSSNEHLVIEDNANGLPKADVSQDEDTEAIMEVENGVTCDVANLDGVSPSPQPPIREQTVADSAADVDNFNGASLSPQPPNQDQTVVDNAPSPTQKNNNNKLNGSKQFVNGSVHVPTGVGDLDEPVSNRGSRGDLRDPAMYKMRSSLPMDAYGDSNSQHLPALIHPDPRLAHSLPASTDHPNIPNGYYNGTDHHGGAHRTRNQIPRIPSATGSNKAGTGEGDMRRALKSAKLPSSVMKMSTVIVSARKRAVLNRNASVFYEERQHSKVITLDQAINSRPPMPFDLDGPGPWSYSPRNKPLNEDNAPEYTFGHRLNEKSGGGRTAYAKTWFNSKSGFTQKVQYEKRWPSPAHYNSTRPLLGCRKLTMLDYPSFTIGAKSKFSISKRGSENEPAPNEYNRSKSDAVILRTAPSYTISRRHQGTKLWSGNEATPGPGTYNPRWGHSSGIIHHPSFTIQGVRRTKSHQLGPHATF